MKKGGIIFLFSLIFKIVFAQDPEQLDSLTLQELFTPQVCRENGINFPIFRVYAYADIAGSHQLVLTEHPFEKDVDSIQAFCFKVDAGGHIEKLNWKLTDFIEKEQQMETSMWFWTKYLTLEDSDNDGAIDPILVYGTSGSYSMENGRLKIFVYHKGIKYGIRHQNDPTDYGRNTKVDKEFYSLPIPIQKRVIQLMQQIQDNGKSIFPYGWQDGMKNKKLYMDEK